MIASKTSFYKAALNGLYYTGAFRALEPAWRGVGVIFTLHHVQPGNGARAFAPNRILEVTPEFLDQTVRQVRELGYEIVSLDEVHRRLSEHDYGGPFACFTFDDGYLDNYTHAFPIFRKHDAPFAIYVCTGIMERAVDLWWCTLEQVVQHEDRVEVTLDDGRQAFASRTTDEKYQAFNTIYWAMRAMPLGRQLATSRALAERYPESAAVPVPASAPMSWPMLREMHDTGLLTIGAHTIGHHALSKLPPEAVREEIRASRDAIARQTGATPRHFAYPYGDALSAASREFALAQELGMATGVTTRKGVLFPEHAAHLHGLPRVSLNGDYQHSRYVRLFVSGAPFALSRGFRRHDPD